jgi:hypothetical protein
MPWRDADAGRAASAWQRACAARTSWLGRYASAVAWPAHFPGLDAGPWTASPFGTVLAEVLGTPAAASRRPAPQRRRPPDPPPADRPPRRGAAASATPAPVSNRRKPATGDPAANSRKAGRAPVVAVVAAPSLATAPPVLTATRMPRAVLARLAGGVRPPAAPVAPARRSLLEGAPRAAMGQPRPATPPGAAGNALGRRLAGRLANRFAKPADGPGAGRQPAAAASDVEAHSGRAAHAPELPGWRRLIGPPAPGLTVRLPSVPPARGTPGPRPGPAWRPGRATPGHATPGHATPGHATSVPAQVAGQVAGDRPARAATPEGDAGASQLPASASAGTPAAQFPHVRTAAAPLAVLRPAFDKPAFDKPAIDPVDFAALLRATLLDEAQRQGIEV